MKSNQTLYPVMRSLLQKTDEIALSSQGPLQTFGAMHIGEIIKVKAESEFDFIGWNMGAYGKTETMLIEIGSPADWAFTLGSLIDSVSFHMKISKSTLSTVFIRKLVFENYARKLRGSKRIAFIANLCACMHYDTKPYRSVDMISDAETTVYKLQSMVDDTLDNFGIGSSMIADALDKLGIGSKKKTTEVGIYLAFMCLIMADVAKHVESNNAKCLNYIKKANLKSYDNESRFFGLWEFLIFYSKMIQNDKQLKEEFTGLQVRALLLPDCQARWKKGFCAIRNGKFPDGFVNTWFKMLGNVC